MSPQRQLQLRNIAKGSCAICGKPRTGGDPTYCPNHREQNRKLSRARYRRKHGIAVDAPLFIQGRPTLYR